MPDIRTLSLEIQEVDGTSTPILVEVVALYNFGYAGRDQASIAEHVQELAKLGLPAPGTIPAVFPLPATSTTTADEIVVAGGDSYGEVEYALVLSEEGWLVTVASDHSDLAVEKLSTPRSKAMCPDVLSAQCWRLADVEAHWDLLELTCDRADAAGQRRIQAGHLAELRPPRELIKILQVRLGAPSAIGTVVLSGTLGGEPAPGASRWTVRLGDPLTGRTLEKTYRVKALPDELLDRGQSAEGSSDSEAVQT